MTIKITKTESKTWKKIFKDAFKNMDQAKIKKYKEKKVDNVDIVDGEDETLLTNIAYSLAEDTELGFTGIAQKWGVTKAFVANIAVNLDEYNHEE